ncbi:MAG: PQQ-dependent sugar dehydrogenase [Thermoanaerobaculia bacterium]
MTDVSRNRSPHVFGSWAVLAMICWLAAFAAPASAELAAVSLQAVAAGLEDPLGIVNAGDQRLFIEDAIWALGLRNPWRFSFDRATGDLFIGDVGQNTREEIDFQPAGGGGENYGWKMMEGTLCLGNTNGCSTPPPGCDAPEYTPPILEYAHGGGLCAIIAGYVYRGTQIPELAGLDPIRDTTAFDTCP